MTQTDRKGRSWYRSWYRWLYRGQHPNLIARFENRISAILFSGRLLPDFASTLEVTGRKSGRPITLPVAVATVDGKRYLVSMLGENVNWVRNVRAAEGKAVLIHGGRKDVHLEEVPADQRAPILKAYLQIAPGARPHVEVDKDAPLEEFAKVAADYPTFRIDSIESSDQ